MKKNLPWLFTAFLVACTHPANAQQKDLPRIGYLATVSISSIGDRYEPFQQGLRDHGYSVGTNIVLESRSADGKAERLPDWQLNSSVGKSM
jgi:hypothetical protein